MRNQRKESHLKVEFSELELEFELKLESEFRLPPDKK